MLGVAANDWPKIRKVALEVHELEELEPIKQSLSERGYTAKDVVKTAGQDGMELYMIYATRRATTGHGSGVCQ